MIHGYHLILPMYGFWLSNDPRGSLCDFVRRWELARFGKASSTLERKSIDELSRVDKARGEAAKKALKYPAVSITGGQAVSIAKGFASQVVKSGYTIWAATILPEHTHLVVARHHDGIETIAVQLKGAATRSVIEDMCHPLVEFAEEGKRPPRMWSNGQWKVYLDSELAVENAIQCVIDNPVKENKKRQVWSLVTPFTGITKNAWVNYH